MCSRSALENGGVLVRTGHTEAAVDLTAMAGLSGVAVIGEITADDGSMVGLFRGLDQVAAGTHSEQ